MSRARKVSHKCGIELPSKVKEAYEIDKKNGNTFWKDSVDKEMHRIGIAFEILEDDEFVPKNHKRVTGHTIFDVKMDFTRKARWVLDGHKTPHPEGSTHFGVVVRESVIISLTYGTLNDIDIFLETQ